MTSKVDADVKVRATLHHGQVPNGGRNNKFFEGKSCTLAQVFALFEEETRVEDKHAATLG